MERKYVRGVELRAPIAQDSYLHSVPAVTYLEKTGALEFHKDVTFLIFLEQPERMLRYLLEK